MTDQSHLRQSSPSTAIHGVADRPHRTADRMVIAGRRDFIVLLASGVAIYAWALFPSTVESGVYVPPTETSTPSAANVNSAGEGVVSIPVNAYRLMDAKVISSTPTTYGLVTAGYSSPAVNVSQVSVRSKLQALLMMLYSQSGVVDPAALEAKLQALLTLPDSVLAQLMEHPDLADLNKTLDAVFLGTTDLSGVKTELDKIDVTSVPGPSEKIDVVNVNGKPAYVVHTSAVQMGTVDAAGATVSAPPPPGGPVTVTVLSLVQAPASQMMSAFTVAPTSEQLPPPPPPAPASQMMSAFTVAPTSEQLPPPPSPTSSPTSTPTATTPTASEQPTGTPQTSNDVMTSGNKFEPGETAAQHSVGNSPPTNSPATQTAPPSTPATGGASPAEGSGGGATSPSNNEGGGTPSGGETSP